MNDSDFAALIISKIPHQPTKMQREAVQELVRFLTCTDPDSLFLLRGFAGTGKTTLMAALVAALSSMGVETVLLAPTGRAAKVLASYTGKRATTIHKEIYRQRRFDGPDSTFDANINRHKACLFIVDEASMISGQVQPSSIFGTGDVLEDLMHYAYTGKQCRLMLVGDTAQLPPVGSEDSLALQLHYLEGYGMHVFHAMLTEVVRQDAGGILQNATMLRTLLANQGLADWPRMQLNGFADIVRITGNELIESLEQSYSHCGLDETIVVTRSNKRAGIYNNGIRNRILAHEERLASGERVIVVKNNYHWVQEEPATQTVEEQDNMTFIANGEGALVRTFRNVHQLYGLTFADVTLAFPNYDYQEVSATVILDTLQSEAPALTHEQQQQLFNHVWNDYPELRRKRDRLKAVREDAHFNALQIKYGYAITCHKAQGGQWQHVYIDCGYLTDEMLTREYVRWLYTALTRATEKVFLVNWPLQQIASEK